MASLRLDDLTPQFVFKLVDTGVQGLTLAPECGSDRMRKILNKQFTNDEILDKATWIFENGIQNLKLYYMVGLPFEAHADVEAIVTLTEQIRERMLEVARGRGPDRPHPPVGEPLRARSRARPTSGCPWRTRGRPTASSSTCARPSPACRTSTRSSRARARAPCSRCWPSGDRRVADALELAGDAGTRPQARRSARPASTRPSTSSASRAKDEVLPWDIIDNGVSKDYFWKELRRSRAGAPLAALPGDPGLHPLRRLRRDAEPLLRAAREVEGPGDPCASCYSGRLRQ